MSAKSQLQWNASQHLGAEAFDLVVRSVMNSDVTLGSCQLRFFCVASPAIPDLCCYTVLCALLPSTKPTRFHKKGQHVFEILLGFSGECSGSNSKASASTTARRLSARNMSKKKEGCFGSKLKLEISGINSLFCVQNYLAFLNLWIRIGMTLCFSHFFCGSSRSWFCFSFCGIYITGRRLHSVPLHIFRKIVEVAHYFSVLSFRPQNWDLAFDRFQKQLSTHKNIQKNSAKEVRDEKGPQAQKCSSFMKVPFQLYTRRFERRGVSGKLFRGKPESFSRALWGSLTSIAGAGEWANPISFENIP